MFVRLLTPLLLASATTALVSSAHASGGNPKTRPLPYNPGAGKFTPEELAAQKKNALIAQMKSSGQQLGGIQQGNPTGVPTTLALNGSDSCSTPDPISGAGMFTFDNSLATTGTQGQNEPLCLAFNHMAIAHDVWFVWTAPSSGTASMTLCGGTGIDSKIAAYSGSNCPLNGTALACNDDNCGIQSSISFPVTAGNNYMLQVGTYYNVGGGFGSFTMAVVGGAPPNDSCSAATPISGAGPFAFDTTGATTSPQQSGSCGTAGHDIWYDWTATQTGTATLDLCGSSLDSIVAVYAGAGCPSAGTVWCNDDSCGFQSQVTFPCTAGAVYALQIGGYNASTGSGSFTLYTVGGGPANDDCSTPVSISGAGPFTFDTTGATTSAQQSGSCGNSGQDIWYDWTAPSSGVATLALCGSSFDTLCAVYAGAGCPSAGTSWCNDDSCGPQSQVSFPCSAGSVYALQIGGYAANSGPGTFTVNVAAGAPNDDCSTPTPIAGNGSFPFDNTLATTGTQGQTEALCLSFATTGITNDVWFAWTAPSNGTATFSLCNSSGMDSKIAVYAGSGCPAAGSALACNDDFCAFESELTFSATAGSVYLLQIGNYPSAVGANGTFTVNVGSGSGISYLCDPGSAGVIACPCSNPPGGSGMGCDNSAGTGGASISGAGSTQLGSPTLVFTTAGEKPTATTILLQGNAVIAAGANFGQGVRCVGGTLKRLYTRTAVGGSISVPNFGAGDLDIPTRSAALGDPILAGQSRWYMAYYRDPIVLGGCSALSTFNSTNTSEILWQ